jgi:hypothetical protein
VAAEQMQVKADAACAQYQESKEQLYSKQEREQVAAVGGINAQRQAELQAEANLRLKSGHLERVERAAAEARRDRDADVQKAEVAKNEQQAQIASVEAARIELEQQEASAQLQRQVLGQDQISVKAAARITSIEQAMKVAQEKAQLAGSDLAELQVAIKEKQKQVDHQLALQKAGATDVETAKRRIEALKKKHAASNKIRSGKTARVIEDAKQQARNAQQQLQRNVSTVDQVLFKPPVEEWGDTVHLTNDLPAIKERQAQDHSQQKLQAKESKAHMAQLGHDVKRAQKEMQDLMKETNSQGISGQTPTFAILDNT